MYFNTAEPCLSSYLQLVTKSGLEKVQCPTTSLSLSKATNRYKTYIHKCSTDLVNYEEIFHYNAFGWDGSGANPTPFGDFIPVRLGDPLNVNLDRGRHRGR